MSTSPFQYQSLFLALTGPLKAERKKGEDPTQVSAAALQILDWIVPQIEGGFDPLTPLASGLPLGQALLSLDVVHFNEPLMDEWISRYGQASVFSSASPSPAEVLVQNLLKSLDSNLDASAGRTAKVLKWVFEHGPASQVPTQLLPDLVSRLEAKRALGKTSAAENEVREKALELAGTGIDLSRPPSRWTLDGLTPDALTHTVLCPSGRMRTLGELKELARSYPTDRESGQSRLPDPPHGRRLDLARYFVLDPNIDLEKARARLWSATKKNPSAAWTLLEWMEDPPKHSPDCAQRIKDIIQAKDAHGRSYLGFLAAIGRLGDGDDEHLARYLIDPSRNLLSASDISGPQGQGLVEQALVGVRLNEGGDAFDGYLSVKDWVLERFGKEAYLGHESRVEALIDDLVDGLFPQSHGNSMVNAVSELTQSPKLTQALLWSRFNQQLASPPQMSSGLPERRRKEIDSASAQRLGSVVSALVESMTNHPGVLAIGKPEWSQWEGMFYTKANSILTMNAFKSAFKSWLPELERVVLSNHLHWEMPAVPARSRARM